MKTVMPLATVWPDIHVIIIDQLQRTIIKSQYFIFTRKEIPADLDFHPVNLTHPLSVYKQQSRETPE